MTTQVTIQYFDGCPHWKEADRLVREAANDVPHDVVVNHQLVDTPELAHAHSFKGSPTILINDSDPFSDPDVPIGLSCRIYDTPAGPRGVPTKQQIVAALEENTSSRP